MGEFSNGKWADRPPLRTSRLQGHVKRCPRAHFRMCALRSTGFHTLPSWLCRPGRCSAASRVTAEGAPGQPVLLEPGLVVVRQALSLDQQRMLACEAWRAGTGDRGAAHSFFEKDSTTLRGPKGSRGRIFDACDAYDKRLTDILLPACAQWVSAARSIDDSMPAHQATHLLLLYYLSGGRLGFHRDEQANDGTGDEPVVNLSLGAEMDFAVRHEHSEPARVIRLGSGDVILFGGPCRRLLHAVVEVRRDRDHVLPRDAAGGRLSFTLRHAPEVAGHEELYQDFRPQLDDPGRKGPTGDEVLLGKTEADRRLRAMRGEN